jgi:hypothetical protein
MNIDLDERFGLTSCARSARDAQALQFYEADYAGLRGLQSAKEIVDHRGAYRGSPMILDGYFVVEW